MKNYEINLPSQDVNDILTNLKNLDSVVSKFAINLTKDERQSLPTVGKVRTTIVEKVLSASEDNTDIFPKSFSVKNFKNDWETTKQLDKFIAKLDTIYEKVFETRQAISAQAYNMSSSARTYIETANDGNHPGLDVVVDELNKLFTRAVEDDKKVTKTLEFQETTV